MKKKKCLKCLKIKILNEFNNNFAAHDGKATNCKLCVKIRNHKWYMKNKNRSAENRKKWRSKNKKRSNYLAREWRKNNKERTKQIATKYREKNKDKIKECSKKWKSDNAEYIKKYQKEYCKKNRNKITAQSSKRHMERYRSDVLYMIAHSLRRRLRNALINKQRRGSAVKDLGCTIEELKKYLEKKFTKGMSWKNYGRWHIDHIVPLSSFDLTKKSQVKKACHYTNLQPLWAKDNLSKGDKVWQVKVK